MRVTGVMTILAIGSVGVAQTANGVTQARVHDVELQGQRHFSSSGGSTTTPWFTLRNHGRAARHVLLVRLESLAEDGQPHELPLRGPHELMLAPGDERRLVPDFDGRPTMHGGGGLPWYQFRLVIRVEGVEAAALATTGAMCRMPVRRPPT